MSEKAIFASGCFWGNQYVFDRKDGVLTTTVGYTGGTDTNPTHASVHEDSTGHRQAIEIEFDPKVITYEELVKFFFETHDFSQVGGQGPDIGPEYTSAVYYTNENQKETAEKLINELEEKGHRVTTVVEPEATFYPAQEMHQKWHDKTGTPPTCHVYIKKF